MRETGVNSEFLVPVGPLSPWLSKGMNIVKM